MGFAFTFALRYWRQGLIVAAVMILLGYHWNAVRQARNEGRELERAAARIEAAKRIQDMEKNNAQFRSLSARDRCLAFMRDSGLPASHCD
jgi:hypothetical protein